MKLNPMISKIRIFLPFILIVLIAVAFLEKSKSPSLLPPNMSLNNLDIREPNERQFTLPSVSGEMVRLSDFKGKAVLLNFFATWCPPCREEMPSLEELFQAKKDKGMVVLGIANDTEGKKTIDPFVKEYGLTFPVLLDPQGSAFRKYFVRGIPITYLLDRQGRIAGMYRGEADWSSAKAWALIDQLLQESSE